MFWKPIVFARPAGAFNVTDPGSGRGQLAIRFDRAPSPEWSRILSEVWGEKAGGAPEPGIQETTVRFAEITRDEFAGTTSSVFEQCLYETNSRQSAQVAKKMGMPVSKLDPGQASSEYESAMGTIDWG
ncbi:MAG: hypothetical protein ACYC99_13460 [Candidatus Geothermincolia bacterium]